MNTYRIFRLGLVLLVIIITVTGCGGSGSNNFISNGSIDGGSNESGAKVLMGGAIQGRSLPIVGFKNVSTVNGSYYRTTNIVSYSINPEDSITHDGTNLYLVSLTSTTIVRLDLNTGIAKLVAGKYNNFGAADGVGDAAQLGYVHGITNDGVNLYFTDSNQTIRKVELATNTVTTIAGSVGVIGSNDGFGNSASFNNPTSITTDGTNLYVTDSVNGTIRKILISTGEVSTIAGSAGLYGNTDGFGASARFDQPYGITTDGTNLYVLNRNSPANNRSLRKISIATGEVTTLINELDLYSSAMTTDGKNLYITNGDKHTVQKVDVTTGNIAVFAGTSRATGWLDGIGVSARFNRPVSISRSGSFLFVIDAENRTIRKISTLTGEVVSTVIGSPGVDGPAAMARVWMPADVTTDGINLYIADYGNQTIRMMNLSTGTFSTLAGNRGNTGAIDGYGSAARFHNPTGVTTDGANVYVADWSNMLIRKIVVATGETTTLAGSVSAIGSTDGIGTSARFKSPNHISTDGVNLYVTDSMNNTIRKIVISSSEVSTLAGTAGVIGSADGIGSDASFNYPNGITTDGENLYITDAYNHTVRKIVISTGVVTTLAGKVGINGSSDGIGVNSSFSYPDGITTDGKNLYISDTGNHEIRKIVISTGVVSTIAGSKIYSLSSFGEPWGITTNGTSIFFADNNLNFIRKIN